MLFTHITGRSLYSFIVVSCPYICNISISEYCFMMGSFRTFTKYDSYFQNEMLVNLIPLQQSVPHHRSYYYDNYMMRKPCHPSSRLFPLGKVRPQLVILICYCCIKIEQRNFNTVLLFHSWKDPTQMQVCLKFMPVQSVLDLKLLLKDL